MLTVACMCRWCAVLGSSSHYLWGARSNPQWRMRRACACNPCREDLSAKFQETIDGVSAKMKEQEAERVKTAEENQA